MDKLIPAIGITVVSAYCLHAANNKLDPYHLQIVAQQFGTIKTKSDGTKVTTADVDAAKLNLIQINSKYEELLDRQRINDAPITKDNCKQYSEINTQVIYNKTDKIMWNDKVIKYVIDMPVIINTFTQRHMRDEAKELVLITSLTNDDAYYPIYFVPDRFLENVRANNPNEAIHGGFFIFKLNSPSSIRSFADRVYTLESNEISLGNHAYIYVDDKGEMSPVSNPKQGTILARRVEFRKLKSATGLLNENERAALQKVFDEVFPQNHGNKFMLDEETKIEMAQKTI